jgi:hypothetical protein
MATQSYPRGVKVFIDDEDVTSAIFGYDEITLTDVDHIFNNIDITPYVRYVGAHTLKITAEGGIGRVDVRISIKGER